MSIARTIKGKGVDFMEDKDGWHGKAVPADKLQEALKSVEKMGL
jgi:transketolase